jgi:hypothetical protein
MSIKLLGPFSILGVAGLLIAACGDKPEVDAGASLGEPAVLSSWEGWPLTADGAIRRELAELEAQRASSADWPLTADGTIRRELAELEAQRAGD